MQGWTSAYTYCVYAPIAVTMNSVLGSFYHKTLALYIQKNYASKKTSLRFRSDQTETGSVYVLDSRENPQTSDVVSEKCSVGEQGRSPVASELSQRD